jgi:hypothetical protein
MTKKELQKMIDNFQKEVTRKDYEIDRLQRLNGDSEELSRRSKKGHQTKKKNGWYDANKEFFQDLAKQNFHNLEEEKELRKRKNISKAQKKRYDPNTTTLIPGYKGEKGVPAKNRIFESYQVEWIKKQYARKKDVFGKKITYQRIADALGCSVFAVQNIIRGNTYKN